MRIVYLSGSKVKVLDARPLPRELLVKQEASRLVAPLFHKLLLRRDVTAAIRQNTSLSDAIRAKALALAARWREDPYQLNGASWAIVSRPGALVADYRRALSLAEAAHRKLPDDASVLNTLGVAQYRVGQYAAALETLMRSDSFNTAGFAGPQPADIAFLAMIQHQLGQTAASRASLARLRWTIQKNADRWAEDADAQAFLREAEALIEGELAKPKE